MKKFSVMVAAIAMALGTVVVGPAPAASADEGPPIVTFEQTYYMAPVGTAFASPVRVTVTDAFGAPVVGATVKFTAEPDALNGATANLLAPTAVTDSTGTAQVQATAGGQGGRSLLEASVDGGVRSKSWMWMRPPGFRPGEQLASVVAEDQDGVTRDIRDTVHKQTYTIIDNCSRWCGPCQLYAKQLRDASAKLMAEYRVDLQIVTMLQEGVTYMPSTRTDAQRWKTSLGLTNTVLHASGSDYSALYRASEFSVYDDDGLIGSIPTSLLVDPRGVIVDRLVGAQASVDEVVQRVLDAGAKTHKPKVAKEKKEKKARPGDRVTATLDGQSTSAVFEASLDYQSLTTPLGALGYLGDDSDPSVAVRDVSFAPSEGAPLPTSGTLGLGLRRLDNKVKKEPLVSTTLPLFLYASKAPGDWTSAVVVETSVPATLTKGLIQVALDLAEVHAVFREQLETGDYTDVYGNLGDLSAADIDALVAHLTWVDVRATFDRT